MCSRSYLTYKRHLPVESAVELWVKYSLTPYRSCAIVDREEEEEEDETQKKVSALSSQRRACGSKVNSVYCTASLLYKRFPVAVLTTVQE